MQKGSSNERSKCLICFVCILAIVANAILYVGITKGYSKKRSLVTDTGKPIVETTSVITRRFSTTDTLTDMIVAANESTQRDAIEDTTQLTAFRKFGYSNITLMQPMPRLRPMYNFTLRPWKVTSSGHLKDILKYSINWTMIVVVKSHFEHEARRQVVRRTWASFTYLNGVRLETIFVVGTGNDTESAARVKKENEKYGDILQTYLEEVYAEVGFKTLAGMQWVAENFPPHWMYTSADDDMLPDLINLYRQLENLMGLSRQYAAISQARASDMFLPEVVTRLPIHCGHILGVNYDVVHGDCRWCVDNTTYTRKGYPPFCHGGWYSMPVSLASGIHALSRRHRYYRLDDIWITGLLRLAYFATKNIADYFGSKKWDESIGLWPANPNVPNVVKHEFDEKNVQRKWTLLEQKILKEARNYNRIT